MNRKLQHTLQALTTSAAVFGLLLLAGGPPGPALPDPAALVVSAEAAAEGPGAAAGTVRETELPAGQVRRNHRAALAMPYFSFAQGGLRRVTGS
jgi:hypothetical protein